MTNEEKLEKSKRLADAMYYAAQYLTTDASRLHKAMEDYHKFVTNEYHKEEPTIPDIVDEHYWEMLGEKPVSEEFVSEELIDVAKQYVKEHVIGIDKVTFSTATDMFISGANWQKQQDQETIELAEDHAMLAGMEKMKEEMMKKAIDVEVKVDAGGYPYIPQMELYDYDNDVPLAKEGDKYKVVLIKEE